MKDLMQFSLSFFTALLCFAPGVYSSGQVIVWGSNSFGQTTVPAGATNVIAMAAGDNHCLALRADGTLVLWGQNIVLSSQTNEVSGLTNVVSIDAGSSHSLALRSDGSVCLLGRIIYGMGGPAGAVVSPAATNVAALALGSGAQHALVLRADGTVVDWGHIGPTDLTNIPPTAANLVSVAAAAYHAIALRGDGRVVAWGNNQDGSVYNTVPASATNIVAIACGFFGDLGLRADGTVVAWQGSSETYSAAFLKTSGFTNIIDVARPFGDFIADGILGLRRNGTLVSLNGTKPPANATNIAAISPGSSTAMALVASGPPMFQGMSLNRTVTRGANAYFHMTAVGALPMFYQWNCNETNIPGATNTTLTLTNVQPDIAGNYYTLTASNALGTATNGTMYLHVTPLEIYASTTDMPALAGATAKLTATVIGQGLFGYQWFFNGTNLLGMITNSLSLTNVQLEQAGAYSVSASNSYGTVTSSIVNLAVVPLLITAPPTNKSVIAGSSPSFSVAASNAVPLSYQWQFNNTDLPGATNTFLTLTNVQVSQAGLYSVVVTNSYGSVTASARLSVQPFVFNTSGTNLIMTTNGFQFQVTGIYASQSLILYASTDMLSWLPILTNPPTTGSVRFLDSAATNLPQRFYRATEQ